ncbi:hypothetical protein [Spongiactinospora sp. TRM90649]|uniref:ATP-binding protein n=1 Tax=Spongiactinospora sp. TRM90649 TaxID=3031114 RepID=UPI0023F8F416|nr:hypothetical protein [Spongiactinospora sp. TRM90649]MDF5759269.1 hypothetical protein [Spongiactinospora sp. TRM90649]
MTPPTPTTGRTWDLPATHGAPQTARDLTRALLAAHDLTHHADTITQIVSELVANAAVHGKPPIELCLHVMGGAVYGTVYDAAPAWHTPTPDHTEWHVEHGRGPSPS